MSDDYDVGFKKPPRQHQFQPGQSGNPKGRRKGTNNFKTDLVEELEEIVDIKENGVKKKISKQRAMLKSLTAKAVMGDSMAAKMIFAMVLKLLDDDIEKTEEIDLSATEQALLKSYALEILSNFKSKGKSNVKT